MDIEMKNVIFDPLVERETIAFSPLHISLVLMKQFVKALDSNLSCYTYIDNKCLS